MRQQGVHPEDAEGTSAASSRPDTDGVDEKDSDDKTNESASVTGGTDSGEAAESSPEARETPSPETRANPSLTPGDEKRQAERGTLCADEVHADELAAHAPHGAARPARLEVVDVGERGPPHRRKMPNVVSGTGAFAAAASPSARTRRVSSGSMIPSSQSRAVE